jgi:hypothetical protein
VYSEGGEDGLLMQLFSDIGSGGKLFVETGAGDGSFASSRNLKTSSGWVGMYIDAAHSSPEDGFITTDMGTFDNFGDFLKEQGTPKELDLLVLRSSNDFALWISASLADIRPRVVTATFNPGFGADSPLVSLEPPSHDLLANAGSIGPGCSLAAVTWLSKQLEYFCVHVDRLGLYVVCVDSSDVDGVVGSKEHWNNAALLWKILEYHPDVGHVSQRAWVSPEKWMSEQGLALQ